MYKIGKLFREERERNNKKLEAIAKERLDIGEPVIIEKRRWWQLRPRVISALNK